MRHNHAQGVQLGGERGAVQSKYQETYGALDKRGVRGVREPLVERGDPELGDELADDPEVAVDFLVDSAGWEWESAIHHIISLPNNVSHFSIPPVLQLLFYL